MNFENMENWENINIPDKMENPKDVFANLLKFYDEKIKDLENKIKEEESKKVSFDEKFLDKDEKLKGYLKKYSKNENFKNFFDLKRHQDNARNKINEMDSEEKKKIIDFLKKQLKDIKDEREVFLKQEETFQNLYDNYDKIKEAFAKKKKELEELKNNDIGEYEKERKKIKERIDNNIESLNEMFNPEKMKANEEEIKTLKKEAYNLHNSLMKEKFKVRTETYTIVKENYGFLGTVLGFIGGAIIGGTIGALTGGVGGLAVGAAIGGMVGGGVGYAIGSNIWTYKRIENK